MTLRSPSLLVAAALVAASCGETPQHTADRRPPHVVFLSIDTLRADRLGAYGYDRPTSPNIDALARQGVRFEHAIAPKGSTWPSLTTVLTSQEPITHGVRANGQRVGEEHVSLAEVLQAAGYRTAAFLTNMNDAPNRGFETLISRSSESMTQAENDARATEEAIAWLRSHPAGDPFFLWVHWTDPHKPYEPPAGYDRFGDPDYDDQRLLGGAIGKYTRGKVELDDADLRRVDAMYDGQVLSTDRWVGQVLDALEELDLTEETLVVFFSDHGEELFDHARYAFHGASLYDGVLRVPLLMRKPGLLPPGRVVDHQVGVIDIAPTVLDVLDLPAPPGLEGASALPHALGDADAQPHLVFFEYAEEPDRAIYGVRTGRWKYIYNPTGHQPKNPPFHTGNTGFPYAEIELYDLRDDPREQHNVAGEHPEVASEMRDHVLSWLADHAGREGVSGAMSEATRSQLIELGYMGEDDEED